MTAGPAQGALRCDACDGPLYPRQWFCRRCGHRVGTPPPERLLREDLTVEERNVLDRRVAEESPSSTAAWLLWLLFGPLGVHRFYLDQPGPGIAVPFVTVSVLSALFIVPVPGAPLHHVAVAVVAAIWSVEAVLLRVALREKYASVEREVLVEILERREAVAARTPSVR